MHPLTRFLLPLLTLFTAPLTAQTPDTAKHFLTLSGYVDAYYADQSGDRFSRFTEYLTLGPRDQTFSVNVAQIGLAYESERVRGNFVYHAGDMPAAIWSPSFPNIQQANAGINLGPGWWLDAGFFLTHVGYESVLPKDNWLSSNAYLSFNEPFYQSGVRLSYEAPNDWYFELWALNGYNTFIETNRSKGGGVLVRYSPTPNTSLTYTNLVGNDNMVTRPGRTAFGVFNNFYWTQTWSDAFQTVLNVDYAFQNDADLDEPGTAANLFGGYFAGRYALDDRWSLTGRLETYQDPNGFVSGLVRSAIPEQSTGLQVSAATLGGEYRPVSNAYVRAETRLAVQSEDQALFTQNSERVDSRLEILLTVGVYFDRTFRW